MGLGESRLRDTAQALPIMLLILAGLSAAAVTAPTKALLAQATATDISGTWFDASLATSTITIVQNGSTISYTATAVLEDPPFAGMTLNGSGTGHLIGNALDVDYSARIQSGASATGHCSGILRRPDVIAWHCRDSNNADFRPVWIR